METTKALTQIFRVICVKRKSYNHPHPSLCKAACFFCHNGMQLNPFTQHNSFQIFYFKTFTEAFFI